MEYPGCGRLAGNHQDPSQAADAKIPDAWRDARKGFFGPSELKNHPVAAAFRKGFKARAGTGDLVSFWSHCCKDEGQRVSNN